jgi:hypothetical protein
MVESLEAARAEVATGGGPLNEADRALLHDRSTRGFIRDGRFCVMWKGPIAVPASSRSLFVNTPTCLCPFLYLKGVSWYGPEDVADRYVLGLLARGYRWPEDDSNPQQGPESSGIEKPPLDVRLCHLVVTPWQRLYLQWEQSDQPGPLKKCNTAGKYVLMPFVLLAATPFYLVGYYLPGGRLWDWEQVERDRMQLSLFETGKEQTPEAGQTKGQQPSMGSTGSNPVTSGAVLGK